MKKENNELVSATTQLKLIASDGKRYLTDMLDYSGIIALGKEFSFFAESPDSEGSALMKQYNKSE